MNSPTIGRFVHYRTKGVYDLLAVVTDADTCEPVAVYRAVGGLHAGMVWCRPAREFFGETDAGHPRFKAVNPEYPLRVPTGVEDGQ